MRSSADTEDLHKASPDQPGFHLPAWWGALSAALLLGAGAAVAWYQGRAVQQEFCARLLLEAGAVARTLDPGRVKTLAFSPADGVNPGFRLLRDQMTAWAETAGFERVFSVAPRGGALVYGPASAVARRLDVATPGSVCPASEPQRRQLSEGTPLVQDPVPEGGGARARAFAPVRDLRTGRVLMLVGVEADTAERQRAIWRQRVLSLAFAAGLAALLLTAGSLLNRRVHCPPERQGWLGQIELVVTACLGVCLTLAAALAMLQKEAAARRDLFLELAESQTAAFKAAEWDVRDSLMVGMAKYLEDDSRILPEEFHYYVRSLVRGADLQALEWIPCVRAADQHSMEADAQRRGATNFFIFQHGPQGERLPVTRRDMYYPVLYAEPLAGNEAEIGRDIGSDPAWRPALEQAGQTGLPTATGPTPGLDRKGPKALAVFHPVYLREAMPETGWEDTQRTPVGYALAVIRCGALLERALANSAAGDRKTRVEWYQLDPAQAPVWLASWPKARAPEADGIRPLPREGPGGLCVVRPLFALGHTYALVVTPEPAFRSAYPMHGAWVTGAAGLLLTVLAMWLVGGLHARGASLEQEVRTRTEMLRASEESYRRQFLDNQAIMLLINPADGRIISANPAAERFYGYAPGVLRTMRIGQVSTAAADVIQQALDSVLEKAAKQFEFSHCRADGSVRSVEVYLSPIVVNGVTLVHSIVHDITERKVAERRLQEAHQQLLALSRQAGMAEIATSVLHNIGNVLNSLNVSAAVIAERVRNSRSAKLGMVSSLLSEHAADLGAFLASDAKGRQLPGYVKSLADHLEGERKALLDELKSLQANVEHINCIVAMQQNYARSVGVIETVAPAELIEDAVRLNSSLVERVGVQVIREVDSQLASRVDLDRHRVLQILVNLVANAAHACAESSRPDKRITLGVSSPAACLCIRVADNGVGIPAENLTRIFSQGFTTRKDGHGFGLHSGALCARELGGLLRVESDGPGRGAVFTLELPLATAAPIHSERAESTTDKHG